MHPIDWIIVAGYCLVPLGIGVYFSRRAGKSAESFLVADRSLPWWVLGFSACATYTSSGASSAFSMLVYKDGLLGNWIWWVPWVIWMPLVSALWSKYWRRLGIVTTAEFIEARYSGRSASVFRGVYALFMAFGWAVLLNGYCTGWLVSAMGPVFGVDRGDPAQVLLFLGAVVGLTAGYAVMSGAFSVTYSDVPHLLVFVIGNAIFVPIAISAAGGLDAIYATIRALPEQTVASGAGSATTLVGGAHFFDALPPARGLSGITLLALVVNGLFYAAAPSGGEGYTAQLFMSAKNEFHAQVGQLFNAFLSLALRIVPLIFLGLAAAAIYRPLGLAPDLAWGRLVADHAPAGLVGILIAADLAAFLSTIDTQVNWATSYVVNDAYRRFVRREATPSHYVLVCRLCNVLFLVLAVVVGFFVAVGGHGMDQWFTYINVGMAAFILPLAWLRFFWWRFNLWGEISALVVGMPLGYFFWFHRPWPMADGHVALLLFCTGFTVEVIVTLLTPPEKMETLTAFYRKCRPPGLWGPVRDALRPEERAEVSRETRQGVTQAALGCLFCLGLVMTLGLGFARNWAGMSGAVALLLTAGGALLVRWLRTGVLAGLSDKAPTATGVDQIPEADKPAPLATAGQPS